MKEAQKIFRMPYKIMPHLTSDSILPFAEKLVKGDSARYHSERGTVLLKQSQLTGKCKQTKTQQRLNNFQPAPANSNSGQNKTTTIRNGPTTVNAAEESREPS